MFLLEQLCFDGARILQTKLDNHFLIPISADNIDIIKEIFRKILVEELKLINKQEHVDCANKIIKIMN